MPNILLSIMFLFLLISLNRGISETAVMFSYKKSTWIKNQPFHEKNQHLLSLISYKKLCTTPAPSHSLSHKLPFKKGRKFKRKTPPNNAKFNLNLLKFYPEISEEALVNLFSLLYGNSEIGLQVSRCSKKIISKLSEKIREGGWRISHDIGTIDFMDSYIQNTWYHMLKGKKTEYPSLLSYVVQNDQKRLSNTGKINIHYAPSEILESLTGSEQLSLDLTINRREFIEPQDVEKVRLHGILEKWLSPTEIKNLNYLIDYTKGVTPLCVMGEEEEE